MKRGTIVIIAMAIIVAIGGYFGYRAYDDYRFMAALTPHAKNASIRVTNALQSESGAHVTFRELFERTDSDLQEIEKRILDVQTMTTPDKEARSAPVVAYMKATQALLRAQAGKYRKLMEYTSALKSADRMSSEFWNSPGYNQYLSRASSQARDEATKAKSEYLAAIQDASAALGRFSEVMHGISTSVGAGDLVPESVLRAASAALEAEKRTVTGGKAG